MVPLAEAWRSGAWKWSSAQRQAYANDLDDSRALIAVTLSTNRSKGDKDPALWMPAKGQCAYAENWIAIKVKYSLTIDSKEALKLNSLITTCNIPAIISGSDSNVAKIPSPLISFNSETVPSLKIDIAITEIPEFDLIKYEYVLVGQATNPNQQYAAGVQKKWGCEPKSENFKKYMSLQEFFPRTAKNEYGMGVVVELFIVPITLQCDVPTGIDHVFWIAKALNNNNHQTMLTSEKVKFNFGNAVEFVTPTPTPTPTYVQNEAVISAGAFCSPAGAIGKSTSGVSYTCKTSPTDTRNRWRQ
jgi:hypothetical protein